MAWDETSLRNFVPVGRNFVSLERSFASTKWNFVSAKRNIVLTKRNFVRRRICSWLQNAAVIITSCIRTCACKRDNYDTGTSSSSESGSHNQTRLKIKLFIIRRLTLSLHSSSQLLQQLLSNNVFLQLILCPLDFTFVLALKSTPSHLTIYLFVGRRPYVYVDNIFMFLLSFINLLRKIPHKSLSLVLKENNQ